MAAMESIRTKATCDQLAEISLLFAGVCRKKVLDAVLTTVSATMDTTPIFSLRVVVMDNRIRKL